MNNARQTVERWAKARGLWPYEVAPSLFDEKRAVIASVARGTLFGIMWEHVAVWALARETLGDELPDRFLAAAVSFVVPEDTLVKIDALQGSDHHALGELLANALHLWPQLPDDDPVKIKQVYDALVQLEKISLRVDQERADAAKVARMEAGTRFDTERLQDLRRRMATGSAVDMIIMDDLVSTPPPPETRCRRASASCSRPLAPLRCDGATLLATVTASTTKTRDLPRRRRHDDPPAHVGPRLARRLSRGAGRRSR